MGGGSLGFFANNDPSLSRWQLAEVCWLLALFALLLYGVRLAHVLQVLGCWLWTSLRTSFRHLLRLLGLAAVNLDLRALRSLHAVSTRTVTLLLWRSSVFTATSLLLASLGRPASPSCALLRVELHTFSILVHFALASRSTGTSASSVLLPSTSTSSRCAALDHHLRSRLLLFLFD